MIQNAVTPIFAREILIDVSIRLQ